MGLKLRFNLFFQVPPEAVFGAYSSFYAQRGRRLLDTGEDFYRLDLHEKDGDWTLLHLGGGWRWREWCEAQVYVSELLKCTSFLMFVYDGDYWGYRLCSDGVVADNFIQDDSDKANWFPNEPATGNAKLLSMCFPWIDPNEIVPYLQKLPQKGLPGDYMGELRRLNIRVRPNDEFCRFDECAILNFLRLLGVKVEVREDRVTFSAPVRQSFWVQGRQRFEDNKEESARLEKFISEMLAKERRSD